MSKKKPTPGGRAKKKLKKALITYIDTPFSTLSAAFYRVQDVTR